MQSLKYFGAFLCMALMLSLGAFAKDMNSAKFNLTESAKIGTAVLQPGQYTAEWSGPANAATISILRNGKTVATTKGKVKELSQKSPYDAVTVNSKTQRVDEIDFNHRAEALVFRS